MSRNFMYNSPRNTYPESNNINENNEEQQDVQLESELVLQPSPRVQEAPSHGEMHDYLDQSPESNVSSAQQLSREQAVREADQRIEGAYSQLLSRSRQLLADLAANDNSQLLQISRSHRISRREQALSIMQQDPDQMVDNTQVNRISIFQNNNRQMEGDYDEDNKEDSGDGEGNDIDEEEEEEEQDNEDDKNEEMIQIDQDEAEETEIEGYSENQEESEDEENEEIQESEEEFDDDSSEISVNYQNRDPENEDENEEEEEEEEVDDNSGVECEEDEEAASYSQNNDQEQQEGAENGDEDEENDDDDDDEFIAAEEEDDDDDDRNEDDEVEVDQGQQIMEVVIRSKDRFNQSSDEIEEDEEDQDNEQDDDDDQREEELDEDVENSEDQSDDDSNIDVCLGNIRERPHIIFEPKSNQTRNTLQRTKYSEEDDENEGQEIEVDDDEDVLEIAENESSSNEIECEDEDDDDDDDEEEDDGTYNDENDDDDDDDEEEEENDVEEEEDEEEESIENEDNDIEEEVDDNAIDNKKEEENQALDKKASIMEKTRKALSMIKSRESLESIQSNLIEMRNRLQTIMENQVLQYEEKQQEFNESKKRQQKKIESRVTPIVAASESAAESEITRKNSLSKKENSERAPLSEQIIKEYLRLPFEEKLKMFKLHKHRLIRDASSLNVQSFFCEILFDQLAKDGSVKKKHIAKIVGVLLANSNPKNTNKENISGGGSKRGSQSKTAATSKNGATNSEQTNMKCIQSAKELAKLIEVKSLRVSQAKSTLSVLLNKSGSKKYSDVECFYPSCVVKRFQALRQSMEMSDREVEESENVEMNVLNELMELNVELPAYRLQDDFIELLKEIISRKAKRFYTNARFAEIIISFLVGADISVNQIVRVLSHPIRTHSLFESATQLIKAMHVVSR